MENFQKIQEKIANNQIQTTNQPPPPFVNLNPYQEVLDLILVFLSLKIAVILANSVDPDEMPPYAGLHLSLHCLPKYLFTL